MYSVYADNQKLDIKFIKCFHVFFHVISYSKIRESLIFIHIYFILYAKMYATLLSGIIDFFRIVMTILCSICSN